MYAWAMDKIQREIPDLNAATASFLCRAEQRTANAVTNCKSRAQLVEVIHAALRRAGMQWTSEGVHVQAPAPVSHGQPGDDVLQRGQAAQDHAPGDQPAHQADQLK